MHGENVTYEIGNKILNMAEKEKVKKGARRITGRYMLRGLKAPRAPFG
jgi:lipopolysaccharide export system protein LptA